MAYDSISKEEYIKFLHIILEKKEKNKQLLNQIKHINVYDTLYYNCILGYDMSCAKNTYEEEFSFKVTKEENVTIEARDHLIYVMETLVKCYGKAAVVNILKDL